MSIIDSATKTVVRDYTVEELKDQAALMRGYNLVALCAAGSGHAGGTLSIMDITAALYLSVANHDPKNPNWAERDRILWSGGHKAPALYVGLAFAGFCNKEELVTLRKLYSPFQGHPHWLKLPGVEASTGSLGQGLSVAVGSALASRLDGRRNKVFCIMGDGEQQEGNIWEAVMEAAHYKLDNVIGIIDENRLQIDGPVCEVMNVAPLADRYRSFGWLVIECDGHDMEQVVNALNQAVRNEGSGKPTAIIGKTVKGKGVSFMENIAGWHGKVPNFDELVKSLKELGVEEKIPYLALLDKAKGYQTEVERKLDAKMPKFSKDYWWNTSTTMQAAMKPTRMGFGESLSENGKDERVVCLGLDISGSITISEFYAKHPERKNRWFSMGIAEQSATAAAAGLAREGKLPVLGTYATFAAARNLDQIRVSICYGNFNVMIAGAHGGVSVGPDGATHQALEDLFAMCGLPNMTVVVPADSVETRKATDFLLLKHVGPKYIRFAREATPIISTTDTPFEFGKANVIRLRNESKNFIEAFATELADDYRNENEDLSIVACGPMVPEAMRAAWILKQEFGYETRVINMHTLKPLDRRTILKAALDTRVVITAEEHQIGALAWQVSHAIISSPALFDVPVITGAIGVKDRFGDSGAPWELIKEFEVSAEHIAQQAAALVALKKQRIEATEKELEPTLSLR
ncbi:Transketolase-like protein [Candidatus Koribacter versatilis Ellin345]|uniref:Transketolase-like protein n=1 Tax=Koribacter versatilis (strain Ellin345) TaxID=204669 RepID=Q1IPG2_KORVE|nr:transketolase [Candidatus Koribacter versatilis]ABF41238.1 Transketolase-like protein [Candidatus Koribacter versatilis Ellin345]